MNSAAAPFVSKTDDAVRCFTVADRRGNHFMIDSDAFRHNLRETRRLIGAGVRVMQVVKGDGYGIGLERAVSLGLLAGVDGFCAGTPEEALRIRSVAPESDALLFTACPPEELNAMLAGGIIVSVNSIEAMRAVIAGEACGRFYFELECGFGRFGLDEQALQDALTLYLGQDRLKLAGVYTHFGQFGGDALDRGLARFDAALAYVRERISHNFETMAAGTHSLLQHPSLPYSAVDPGRLLYGIVEPNTAGIFRPVVTRVCSRIIQINIIQAGQKIAIGYGGSVDFSKGGTTGIFPLGWYDGLSIGQERGEVIVAGRKVPVIGRTLLHSIVDLSMLDAPVVGDEVVLIGQQDVEHLSWVGAAEHLAMTATELHFKLLGAIGRAI